MDSLSYYIHLLPYQMIERLFHLVMHYTSSQCTLHIFTFSTHTSHTLTQARDHPHWCVHLPMSITTAPSLTMSPLIRPDTPVSWYDDSQAFMPVGR